jgi:hypothetical protein
MRALRAHPWAEVALIAVAAFFVGLFVLEGNAQGAVIIVAVLVILFAISQAVEDGSYRERERHIPPSGPPGPGASGG